MLLNKYLNRASNVFRINQLLAVVTICMAVVTAMLIQQLNREIESRTTVFVPLNSSGVMEVGYDSASEDYLRAIARYIINLAFTYTSDSARSQFEELLTLFAPEQREAERRRLLNIAEKIEKVQRVSRTFFIDDIRKDPEKKKLIVYGTTVRRLGKTLETERAVIEIKYRIQYGRFLIEGMRIANRTNRHIEDDVSMVQVSTASPKQPRTQAQVRTLLEDVVANGAYQHAKKQ